MPMLTDFVIPSPDAPRLGRFLAELLELELEHVDSRITLRGAGLDLCVESIAHGQSLPSHPGPEFTVESEDELHSLWQRYVFVMYRLKGERHGPSAPLARKKVGGEEHVTLFLKDPDHRVWPFKATKSLQ